MLESLEKYEEAVTYYDRLLAIDPNHSETYTRKKNIMNFLKSAGGRHYDSNV